MSEIHSLSVCNIILSQWRTVAFSFFLWPRPNLLDTFIYAFFTVILSQLIFTFLYADYLFLFLSLLSVCTWGYRPMGEELFQHLCCDWLQLMDVLWLATADESAVIGYSWASVLWLATAGNALCWQWMPLSRLALGVTQVLVKSSALLGATN